MKKPLEYKDVPPLATWIEFPNKKSELIKIKKIIQNGIYDSINKFYPFEQLLQSNANIINMYGKEFPCYTITKTKPKKTKP